jgi:hypothetical protein
LEAEIKVAVIFKEGHLILAMIFISLFLFLVLTVVAGGYWSVRRKYSNRSFVLGK